MGEWSEQVLTPTVRQRDVPPTETLPVTPATEPAAQQQPTQPRWSEELLQPGGMFGPSPNPMMAPTPEGERPANVEFDFPELMSATIPGLSTTDTLKLAGGLLVAFDEAQQEDILRSTLPNATVGRDRFNNVFVEIPQVGSFYVNRPGPSMQDVTQFGALMAPATGAARAGATIGSAVLGPTLGRIGGAGAGEAALSGAMDLAAQAAGSEQPISLTRMALAGGAGMAGEAILPLVVRAVQSIAPSVRRPISVEGGIFRLSDEARQAIENAGIDPNSLTQEFIQRLNVEVGRAARPEEAVRMAEAQSLPVPVPLTRGDVTRREPDTMFEDAARKGVYGNTVANIIRGVREEQQEALREGGEAIRQQIAGGVSQVGERGQGGALTQQALVELRDAANRTVRAAYELAENTGQAGIPTQAMPSFENTLAASVADRIEFAPRAQSMLRQIEGLSREAGEGNVLVDSLFNWRRRLTTLAKETTDPTDAAALAQLRRTFDSQIVDIVERGLLEGDDAAVDAWLNAIRERREFGQIWNSVRRESPNYLVDRLTQTMPDGQTRVLTVAPEAASNLIFGSGRTGITSNPALARQLVRLRDTLQEGGRPEAWNALREEAFMRILSGAEGQFGASNLQRAFSGANFERTLSNALNTNPAVMRVLFTPEEIGLMEQFGRVAVAATTPPAGGTNPSGTAAAIASQANSLLGRLIGRLFGPAIQSATQASDIASVPFMLRAARAGRGRPAAQTLTPGIGGAVGGMAVSEPAQDLRR